jgi:two-component system CheB/CheR fusion protein
MKDKYIIALGASAGGLKALYEFFDNTLPDGVSYVITTHLHPHQKSSLAALIQKHSELKVSDVEDNVPVETNQVYVMPENKVMTIENGQLILNKRDLSIKVNKAINIFFNSLAKQNDFKIIAIILSGMGEDGTEGVKAIAASGGFVIAQDPLTAGEQSMPQSVIYANHAHLVLAPKDMPEAIIKVVGDAAKYEELT